MKVLPELLKSVEFGGGGARVFGTVMQIGVKLSDEEFETLITPVVIRLFSNPDRAIRVCLLDNLPKMIDRLPNKIVNDKIFPQMVIQAWLPRISECVELTIIGHWLYRRCSARAREHRQGSAGCGTEIVRSHSQWRAPAVPGKNRQ